MPTVSRLEGGHRERNSARNLDELGKLVVARVQVVDGITRTLTCPVVRL
jgi:hypothetical protein